MRPNPQETADFVTYTEEILNGKLHFLYRDLPGILQMNVFIVAYVQCSIENLWFSDVFKG